MTPAVPMGQVRRGLRQEARVRRSGCFLKNCQPDWFKREAAPNLKQLKCPLRDEWITRLW